MKFLVTMMSLSLSLTAHPGKGWFAMLPFEVQKVIASYLSLKTLHFETDDVFKERLLAVNSKNIEHKIDDNRSLAFDENQNLMIKNKNKKEKTLAKTVYAKIFKYIGLKLPKDSFFALSEHKQSLIAVMRSDLAPNRKYIQVLSLKNKFSDYRFSLQNYFACDGHARAYDKLGYELISRGYNFWYRLKPVNLLAISDSGYYFAFANHHQVFLVQPSNFTTNNYQKIYEEPLKFVGPFNDEYLLRPFTDILEDGTIQAIAFNRQETTVGILISKLMDEFPDQGTVNEMRLQDYIKKVYHSIIKHLAALPAAQEEIKENALNELSEVNSADLSYHEITQLENHIKKFLQMRGPCLAKIKLIKFRNSANDTLDLGTYFRKRGVCKNW